MKLPAIDEQSLPIPFGKFCSNIFKVQPDTSDFQFFPGLVAICGIEFFGVLAVAAVLAGIVLKFEPGLSSASDFKEKLEIKE